MFHWKKNTRDIPDLLSVVMWIDRVDLIVIIVLHLEYRNHCIIVIDMNKAAVDIIMRVDTLPGTVDRDHLEMGIILDTTIRMLLVHLYLAIQKTHHLAHDTDLHQKTDTTIHPKTTPKPRHIHQMHRIEHLMVS